MTKARNNSGRYVSLKERLLILVAFLLTVLITAYFYYFNRPMRLWKPLIPAVYPVQAYDLCANRDCIDDPLYLEIKHDPVKKYIYMQFAQINTKVAREALEVAKQESNFNPKIKNKGSTASGIFQIIAGTWRGYKCSGDVFNYVDNINCAVKIYKSNNNWRQWVAKPIYL